MSAATKAASTRWPVSTLTLAFVAWKCFLGAIAAGATLVGDAYDTSGGSALGTSCGSRWGSGLLARFTSWDAIYFVNVARRGYLYEQEWAFGSGMAGGMTRLAQGEFAFVCWKRFFPAPAFGLPTSPAPAPGYWKSPNFSRRVS